MENGNTRKNRGLLRILLAAGVLLLLFSRFLDQWLLPAFKAGLDATGPFIWGFVLAYLLRFAVNPLQKLFERLTRAKPGTRWARLLSAALCLLLTVGFITGLAWLLAPQIYDNIIRLSQNMPSYLDSIANWLIETAAKLNLKLSSDDLDLLNSFWQSLGNLISQNTQDIVTLAGKLLLGIGTGVFDTFIAFIVAFYLLADASRYKRLTKRLLRSFMKDETKYNNTLSFIHESDSVMGRYIGGRLIQLLIFTILACIGFGVVGLDYFLLVGVMVGVLNIIPYIGPWIAAIPALILALLESPATALWTLVVIIALQLLDNFVLGPRILGDRLRVSPLWIFVGIIIGGAMFGLPGMLLGAPAVAIIGKLLEKFVEYRENASDPDKNGAVPVSGFTDSPTETGISENASDTHGSQDGTADSR